MGQPRYLRRKRDRLAGGFSVEPTNFIRRRWLANVMRAKPYYRNHQEKVLIAIDAIKALRDRAGSINQDEFVEMGFRRLLREP